MTISARELADFLNGEIVGNPDVTVSSPARIEQGRSGNICFLANMKYEQYIYTSKASIFLVNKSFTPAKPIDATLIKVDNAYESVASLLEFFQSKKKQSRRISLRSLFNPKTGRGTTVGRHAIICRGAKVGRWCTIHPQVYIGENVKIGDNCIIYPGVRIYHDCVIGNNCILHANCVIGADGFGFAPRPDGTYKKIPQTGNVVLEDDVEIGANSTVDRATMNSTIIHRGVKVDNLCQIAHNVEVGHDTVMAAQTGIAGSTHIGANCMFGGQTGIVGHLHIADRTTTASRAGVIKDVKEEGKILMGLYAFDRNEFLRAYAKFKISGRK